MGSARFYQITLIALLVSILLIGYGFFASSQEAGRLKERIENAKAIIASEQAERIKLESEYNALMKEKTVLSLRVDSLRADRKWWYNQAMAYENELQDAINQVFVGSDSSLARRIYSNFLGGSRN